MKIYIASDHRGIELKSDIINYLKSQKIEYINFGTDSEVSIDYPNIVSKVAKSVQCKECDCGILICGTGLGVAITANKFKGIRAANCYNNEMAKYSRLHNNSNIISFGATQNSKEEVIEMLKIWLNTQFEGGRHEKRIKMIEEIENENMK